MIYKTFFLCTGGWQQELHEQLNELSEEGWEFVQLSEGLLNGNEVCGYGLFRKAESMIHARWQYCGNNGYKYVFRCTNCDKKIELELSDLNLNDMPKDFYFCQNCGAKMDKTLSKSKE